MPGFDAIDWRGMLLPDTPVLEIVIRGTVMYIGLLLLLRFVQRRPSSSMSTTDVLVIVLLADASQNAMAGDYKSLPDGLLLVAVIVTWSLGLNWLGYHSRRAERLLHPPPTLLVRDGVPDARALRRELITDEELMSALREQGIRDIADVEEAQLEGNGKLSVFGRGAQPASDDEPTP